MDSQTFGKSAVEFLRASPISGSHLEDAMSFLQMATALADGRMKIVAVEDEPLPPTELQLEPDL